MGSIVALLFPSLSQAQTYQVPQPRRQFVTVSLDWLYTQPLHFAEHPLEDLLGTEVGSAAAAGLRLRNARWRHAHHGPGVQTQESGWWGDGLSARLRTGTTLGIRGSFEGLPDIRVTFEGAAPFSSYVLTHARAFDVGAGFSSPMIRRLGPRQPCFCRRRHRQDKQ